jgi:DNA helicase-2/ATP-dependent DNA helicase PcrA
MFQLSFDGYLEELKFKASKYQQAIFDWIQHGEGSCVVSAVPGSGKTTTLIEGCKYLPFGLNSKFLAFNKHIVNELKSKLPKNVACSTIHSLGFGAVKKQFPNCKVSGFKYNQICRQYLADKNVKAKEDLECLIELMNFVRLTLTDFNNLDKLKYLINYYSISITDNWTFWQKAVGDVLEIGIEQAVNHIDFNDMIWLPNALDLSVSKSDFLFIDEAQDLNKAQLQLVLKSFHSSTRALFVGDKFQAIMSFSGADSHSIDTIINATNAIELPLSISYRLPKLHVDLANRLYPVIEPASNAIDGVLEKGSYDDIPEAAEANDLIICRCFYPLIKLYFALLKLGKPAQIKKLDISKQLISLIEKVFGNYNQPGTLERIEFKRTLNAYYLEARKELLDNKEVHALMALQDKVETIKAIYEGAKCKTIHDCIFAIQQLAKPKDGNPINLTTIHGAKGLEANRVFVARCDLLPHPLASKSWEKEQEKNLFFVAITRAKEELYLC